MTSLDHQPGSGAAAMVSVSSWRFVRRAVGAALVVGVSCSAFVVAVCAGFCHTADAAQRVHGLPRAMTSSGVSGAVAWWAHPTAKLLVAVGSLVVVAVSQFLRWWRRSTNTMVWRPELMSHSRVLAEPTELRYREMDLV